MDIIERAARALSDTLQHHGVEMDPEDVRDAVLDVIAALREPDEGMLEGPWTFNPAETSGLPPTQAMMKLVWQAMIDQALKG